MGLAFSVRPPIAPSSILQLRHGATPCSSEDINTLADKSFGTPEHIKLVFVAMQSQEHRDDAGDSSKHARWLQLIPAYRESFTAMWTCLVFSIHRGRWISPPQMEEVAKGLRNRDDGALFEEAEDAGGDHFVEGAEAHWMKNSADEQKPKRG